MKYTYSKPFTLSAAPISPAHARAAGHLYEHVELSQRRQPKVSSKQYRSTMRAASRLG